MPISQGDSSAGPLMTEVTVPLSTVLNRADLGMSAIVPPADPEVAIRWAHPSEVRDPVPYLLGSELLLTAGVALPASEREVDEYVSGLARVGVRALGFGLTPIYDSVPAALVAACRRHGLPLLEIPDTTPFLAISRAVGEALNEARTAGLRRLSEAEIALTRAATRADPVAATLTTLAKTLRCWAVLITAGGEFANTAGNPPDLGAEVLDLAARLRDGSGPRSGGTELDVRGVRQPVVLHPVESAATSPSVLAVGRNHGFTVPDRAVLAVAVALLGVLDRERAGGVERGHSTLAGLLLDPSTSDSAVASTLGVAEGDRYRVMHAEPRGGTAGEFPVDTALVVWEGNRARAILPPDRDPLDDLDRCGWNVGLSDLAGAQRLPAADATAAVMLERSRASGRPVRADAAGVGLSEMLDPVRAGEIAWRLLAPVAESQTAECLLRTLRSWLAHHGSWQHSSVELGIHRNSVRHRIRQVERLLGIDLADPQRRMELWFALQWLPPA